MLQPFIRLAAFLCAVLGAASAHAACTLGAPGATQRIEVPGTTRTAQLHLPASFDPARPAPLILLLHGSGGTGAAMLDQSKLAETADRHGFVVAAPDAGIGHDAGFVWNIPGVPAVNGKMPGKDAPDDVRFLTAVIDALAAAGCIDPARVAVTGLSGGGRMASWLGCVAADRFAAILPVVGLRAGNPSADDPQRPDPATCRPSRPVPVMAFAGDADTVNPIAGGGAPYWRYSMHAAEQRWAAIDRCTAAPATRWIDARTYEERYAGCAGGSEVVARVTVGETHRWVADNEALWAFASRFSRQP